MTEDLSFKCPSPMSTLSVSVISEVYEKEISTYDTTALSNITSTPSSIGAITEEGLASFPSFQDSISTCQFSKRLCEMQLNFHTVIEEFKRDLMRQFTDNQHKADKATETIKSLEGKVESYEIENQKLKTEISTIKNLNEEVTRLQIEIEELKESVEKKDRTNTILKDLLKDNKPNDDENVQNLKSKITNLTKHIDGLDCVMEEVLEKNKCLTKECKHLKTSIHDFGIDEDFKILSTQINTRAVQLREENERLKDVIEKKKDGIHSMKGKIRISQRNHNEFARTIGRNEVDSKEINSKLEDYDILDQINRDLKEELDKIKETEIEWKHVMTTLPPSPPFWWSIHMKK